MIAKAGGGDDTADKILGIEEKKPPRRGLGKTSISQGPQTQFARHRSGDRTRDVCGCTAGREYLRWSQRLVWRRRDGEREREVWVVSGDCFLFSSHQKKTLFAFPAEGHSFPSFPFPHTSFPPFAGPLSRIGKASSKSACFLPREIPALPRLARKRIVDMGFARSHV